MGKVVEEFESKRGRPPTYPWEEWTNGESWLLYKEQDFQANLVSFRTMVHRKARDLGLKAFTKINDADASIKIRFYEG